MIKEKEIILIYFEDNPTSFARVEDISPDVKKGWYIVKLLLLQVPVQVVTWILREEYINGESFTMNGKKMHFQHIVCPDISQFNDEDESKSKENKSKSKEDEPKQDITESKVISLRDRIKK